MEQKVIQIGSSAGITMSKSTMEELGVKIGDTVETDTAKKVFTVRSRTKTVIDPEILQWGQEFIDKNRALLERLKNK